LHVRFRVCSSSDDVVVGGGCKVVVASSSEIEDHRANFGTELPQLTSTSTREHPTTSRLRTRQPRGSPIAKKKHPITTMSLLRSSRLITTSAIRSTRTFTTQFRRYADEPAPKSNSSEAPNAPASGESELISQEGPGAAMTRHAPDYSVAVDYRTSYA
jgi:hypothetical protein